MTKNIHVWCDGSYRQEHRTVGIAWVRASGANDPAPVEHKETLPKLLDSHGHGSDFAELKAFASALSQIPDGTNVTVHMDCKNAIQWLTDAQLSKKKAQNAPSVKAAFEEALVQKKRMGRVDIIFTSDKNHFMGIAHKMSRHASSPPDKQKRVRKKGAQHSRRAPIEHLDYKDVNYWDELTSIFEWARTNVYSSFFICWGAQAALHHFHGVNKHATPQKQFGIIKHNVLEQFHPLTAGFDGAFDVPVARNTEVLFEDVAGIDDIEVLATSDETGICLAHDETNRRTYMFNHLEYDANTLSFEYFRDKESGFSDTPPKNYFPGDDPTKQPQITWRAHRTLLFSNWINMVYQGTPYNLADLGKNL